MEGFIWDNYNFLEVRKKLNKYILVDNNVTSVSFLYFIVFNEPVVCPYLQGQSH